MAIVQVGAGIMRGEPGLFLRPTGSHDGSNHREGKYINHRRDESFGLIASQQDRLY